MSSISKIETRTTVDENGVEITTKKETTIQTAKNNEPSYLKIYTDMWAEFNGIPYAYRGLFLQLCTRMSYCNATDIKDSQIISTTKLFAERDIKALGCGIDMYRKGLKKLCECGAIKKLERGTYQINPQYAGKGTWKYNPKLKNGGIENLVAQFNFRDNEVETEFLWADDGEKNEYNDRYRAALGTKSGENATLTQTKKKLKVIK